MLTAKQFIDAIKRRLKTARGIDVRYREGLEPFPTAERDEMAALLKSYLGQPLTAEMRRRLSFPRHLKLYWEYTAAGEANLFNGEISLNNVGVALLEKDFSFMDYGANPELTYLDIYRILEDHPYMGDGYLTVLGLNDAFTDVELFALEKLKPLRLRLNFEEYHRCVAWTLGYGHWQYLFIEGLPPSMSEYMQKTYRPKLIRDLGTLWPDDDLSEFLALVDRAR